MQTHGYHSSNAVSFAQPAPRVSGQSNANIWPANWTQRNHGEATNSATIVRSEGLQNASFDLQEFRTLRARLASLHTLDDGWDGIGSVRPCVSVMTSAAAHLMFALQGRRNVSTPAVVPIPDGGVQAEWYSANSRFEIYFEADGEIAAWSENRVTGVEMEAEGTDAIQLLIDWASNYDAAYPELA
jgi:hypothetical protein